MSNIDDNRSGRAEKKADTGLRFNAVGRDDPAKVVIVPRLDPASRRRRIITVALALAAIVVLILLVANPFGIVRQAPATENGVPFAPPRDGGF